MADPLSPQVGGGILFCACEANVSVANKAKALRRRCCCCAAARCKACACARACLTAFLIRAARLLSASARAANLTEQLTAVAGPVS
jgi:hypothetical protein